MMGGLCAGEATDEEALEATLMGLGEREWKVPEPPTSGNPTPPGPEEVFLGDEPI